MGHRGWKAAPTDTGTTRAYWELYRGDGGRKQKVHLYPRLLQLDGKGNPGASHSTRGSRPPPALPTKQARSSLPPTAPGCCTERRAQHGEAAS